MPGGPPSRCARRPLPGSHRGPGRPRGANPRPHPQRRTTQTAPLPHPTEAKTRGPRPAAGAPRAALGRHTHNQTDPKPHHHWNPGSPSISLCPHLQQREQLLAEPRKGQPRQQRAVWQRHFAYSNSRASLLRYLRTNCTRGRHGWDGGVGVASENRSNPAPRRHHSTTWAAARDQPAPPPQKEMHRKKSQKSIQNVHHMRRTHAAPPPGAPQRMTTRQQGRAGRNCCDPSPGRWGPRSFLGSGVLCHCVLYALSDSARGGPNKQARVAFGALGCVRLPPLAPPPGATDASAHPPGAPGQAAGPASGNTAGPGAAGVGSAVPQPPLAAARKRRARRSVLAPAPRWLLRGSPALGDRCWPPPAAPLRPRAWCWPPPAAPLRSRAWCWPPPAAPLRSRAWCWPPPAAPLRSRAWCWPPPPAGCCAEAPRLVFSVGPRFPLAARRGPHAW